MTSESIIVEADNNGEGQANTHCQGGNTCTMSFRTCPFALLVKTGSGQHHDGYIEVLVDSGNGFVSVAPYGFYNLGSIVVDKCFPDIINVQVRTMNDNAWVGRYVQLSISVVLNVIFKSYLDLAHSIYPQSRTVNGQQNDICSNGMRGLHWHIFLDFFNCR